MGSKWSLEWQTDDNYSCCWSRGPCYANNRAEIIVPIIRNRSTKHLKKLLKSGWDLNETLKILDVQTTIEEYSPSWLYRTAIKEAVKRGWAEGVAILLDAGAKWPHGFYDLSSMVLDYESNPDEANLALFTSIVKFVADQNWQMDDSEPILHYIICAPSQYRVPRFMVEYLDIFYQNGGNITMEDGNHVTPLEYTLRNNCHSNTIRWLIRHGADIHNLKVTLLKGWLIPSCYPVYHFAEIPLILLQAGMRVSHGAQAQLVNIMNTLEATQQEDISEEQDIRDELEAIWTEIEVAEELELMRRQFNSRKSTFPEYCPQQMVDMQEFSDEHLLLQVYPEDVCMFVKDLGCQYALDQTRGVVEFLSETQSLQWHCRRCVRESLVSLAPSVVKTLPIASRLKQFILCHEI